MNLSQNTTVATPLLLRIEQVCHLTGLGRTMIYELISRGQLPAPIKLGRASRWPAREIEEWIRLVVLRRGL